MIPGVPSYVLWPRRGDHRQRRNPRGLIGLALVLAFFVILLILSQH